LDSSPNYLTNPNIYKRLSEVCPEAKLIVCLRNPIDRAYSQYNHYRYDMPKTIDWDWNHALNLEENIKLELSRAPDFKKDFSNFIGRGVYINQIEQLMQYFDLSQIHITILEHWKENYKEELMKILNFLNIEPEPLPLLPRHCLPYNFEPMSLETRALLRELYAPYNQRLFKLINFEIPEWFH